MTMCLYTNASLARPVVRVASIWAWLAAVASAPWCWPIFCSWICNGGPMLDDIRPVPLATVCILSSSTGCDEEQQTIATGWRKDWTGCSHLQLPLVLAVSCFESRPTENRIVRRTASYQRRRLTGCSAQQTHRQQFIYILWSRSTHSTKGETMSRMDGWYHGLVQGGPAHTEMEGNRPGRVAEGC